MFTVDRFMFQKKIIGKNYGFNIKIILFIELLYHQNWFRMFVDRSYSLEYNSIAIKIFCIIFSFIFHCYMQIIEEQSFWVQATNPNSSTNLYCTFAKISFWMQIIFNMN